MSRTALTSSKAKKSKPSSGKESSMSAKGRRIRRLEVILYIKCVAHGRAEVLARRGDC